MSKEENLGRSGTGTTPRRILLANAFHEFQELIAQWTSDREQQARSTQAAQSTASTAPSHPTSSPTEQSSPSSAASPPILTATASSTPQSESTGDSSQRLNPFAQARSYFQGAEKPHRASAFAGTEEDAKKLREKAEAAYAQAQALRLDPGITRANYLKIYELEQSYIDWFDAYDTYRTNELIQKNLRDINQQWDDFNQKGWYAWILSVAYGGLQGWGMAGFAAMMMDSADVDPWISHLIALAVATPVALMNTWLVQPELEDYITFKKYKKLLNTDPNSKHNIHPTTIILCGLASVLLGAITAFGITSSLQDDNAYIHTDNPKLIGLALGGMTVVLSLAESLLNIQSFDDAYKEGFWNQETNLYKKYSANDTTTLFGIEIEKRTKAKIIFNASFVCSCLGMLGLALVGTDTLSGLLLNDNPTDTEELGAMGFACGILTLAAATQIPFYRDRAKRITEQWVPVDTTAASQDESLRPVFNDKSVVSRTTSSGLWIANAVFNAPCAYLGVVSTLAKFMGIEKHHDQNAPVWETIFCQFGMGDSAKIAYGIGAAFFLCAVGISLAANYPAVTKMADPRAEYAEKVAERKKKEISL